MGDILKRLRELEGKAPDLFWDEGWIFYQIKVDIQPKFMSVPLTRDGCTFYSEAKALIPKLLDVCEAARELMSSYRFLYRGEGGLVGCPPKEIFTIDVGAKLRDALARLEGDDGTPI